MSFSKKKIRRLTGVGLSVFSAICASQVSYAVTKVWNDNRWIGDENGLVDCCNVEYRLDGKSLVISGRGIVMRDSIDNNLNYYETRNISEIRISRGITVIGKNAFEGFFGLREVYIPDSVKIIDSCAFLLCNHLGNITIPKSVTVLGDSAFFWCTSLKKVDIPNSVNRIGKGCFSDCKNLREVKFENMACGDDKYCENSCSEVMVDERAFYLCLNLKFVDTGNRTAHFADGVFRRCDSKFRLLEGKNVCGKFYNTFLTIKHDNFILRPTIRRVRGKSK